MNLEGLLAASFALGLGAEFIVNKVGSGIMAISEMMDSNTSVISDVNSSVAYVKINASDINNTIVDMNSSIVDINTTISDLNSTVDANASLILSALEQLLVFV